MSTATNHNNKSSNVFNTKYNQIKTIKSRVAESLQQQQQKPEHLKPILKPSTVTSIRYLNSTSPSSLQLTTNPKEKNTVKDMSRYAPKINPITSYSKDTKVHRPKAATTMETEKNALIKQSSSPTPVSTSSVHKIAPNQSSASTPTKPASLQSLKVKFAAKNTIVRKSNTHSSIDKKEEETQLPWNDYTLKKTKAKSAFIASTNDYDKMIQELGVSYAMATARKFETMCFVEADQLNKKLQDIQKHVCSLYERIRIKTDKQRSTATLLKLNYVSLPIVSNFINEVCQTSEDTSLLIDELYFAGQHAHHTETRYLRHIAGTLATMLSSRQSNLQQDVDERTDRKKDDRYLTAILNNLESILLEFDDSQQRAKSKSSSMASTCSLSSSSTASTICSGFTSINTIDTTTTMSTESNSTATTDLQRHINSLINKISALFQQKQERIHLFETQSATLEELARQHERSASLVLAMEQSRPQRLILAKQQEKEISTLKEQLLQEKQKRQILQDRVTELECQNTELKKGLAAKSPHPSHGVQLQEGSNREEELKKALEEKTKAEQSILRQCYRAINEAGLKDIDAEIAVIRVTQQLAEARKQIKDALALKQELQKDNPIKEESTATLDRDETTASPSHYDQLRLAFEDAQQAYTARESAYILQTASIEAELGRILKEYDRLTRNIVDFNFERKRYEDEIRALQIEKQRLIQKVCDQRVCGLNEGKSLRKEFRDLMATVKENHNQALMCELDRRLQLEQELRNVKSDIEIKRWEKIDVAVQTNFVPLITFPSP